jgi:hypothetical protein
MDGRGIAIRFPAGEKDFSHLHRFQTISVAHPSSDLIAKKDYFPEVKAVWT